MGYRRHFRFGGMSDRCPDKHCDTDQPRSGTDDSIAIVSIAASLPRPPGNPFCPDKLHSRRVHSVVDGGLQEAPNFF